jgi:hypothetical protein
MRTNVCDPLTRCDHLWLRVQWFCLPFNISLCNLIEKQHLVRCHCFPPLWISRECTPFLCPQGIPKCLHESVQKLPGQKPCKLLHSTQKARFRSEIVPNYHTNHRVLMFFTTQKRIRSQPTIPKAAGGMWKAAGGWSLAASPVRE